MVKALTLFVLTTMRVGGTTVDGPYLTTVKQTEHMIRRPESDLFGYMADLSDLFNIKTDLFYIGSSPVRSTCTSDRLDGLSES